MRTRKMMEMIMAGAGVAAVITGIVLAGGSGWQVGAVLLGLILLWTGVWSMSTNVLPEERRFVTLRQETDLFLGDVRELNWLVVEGKTAEAENLRARMHERVGALLEAAGQEAGAASCAGVADPERPGDAAVEREAKGGEMGR